ncbi:MAG: hypothetical protein WC997_01715 [Porticoccaceae bacterium]
MKPALSVRAIAPTRAGKNGLWQFEDRGLWLNNTRSPNFWRMSKKRPFYLSDIDET